MPPVSLTYDGGPAFSCHCALGMVDIFLQVLDHLTAEELVRAALVCRAWAMALDIRWSHRPVPLGLLLQRLAPLKVTQHTNGEPPKLTFVETPPLEAWERFIQHVGCKVTILFFDKELDITSTRAIVQFLESTPSAQLCPNLKSLEVHVDTNDWEILLPFFTSRLEILHMKSTMAHSDLMLPALTKLAITSIKLKELTWHVHAFSPYINEVCMLYGTFQSIRVLKTSWMSVAGWSLLQQCTALEQLRLTGSIIKGEEGEVLQPVIFPSLRDLVICSTQSLEVNLLCHTTMSALNKLHLEGVDDSIPSGEKLHSLFEFVARESPILEDVALSSFKEPGCALQLNILRSLRPLGSLRKLKLFLGEWQAVVDKHIDMLLQSLPLLRSFTILSLFWSGPVRGSRLTGDTFLSFAKHCPELEKLEGLPVDFAMGWPDADGEATDITIFPALRCLSFGMLKVPDNTIPKLAGYLARACPNLQRLDVEELWEGLGGKEYEARHGMMLVNAFQEHRATLGSS